MAWMYEAVAERRHISSRASCERRVACMMAAAQFPRELRLGCSDRSACGFAGSAARRPSARDSRRILAKILSN